MEAQRVNRPIGHKQHHLCGVHLYMVEMHGEGWNIDDEDVYMGICVICQEGRRIRLLNDPSLEAKRLLVPLCKPCWD